METVREQLVKKPTEQSDKIKQYGILALSLFLAMAAVILIYSFMGGLFMIMGLLLAGIILWGGYTISGMINIEYEYCIAGSELSVDKIIDRRKRKTLCSFSLRGADGFYSGKKELSGVTVISATGEGDVYTIEYKDEKYGRTLLQFTPDERTIEMISPYLPRLSK